MIRFNRLRIEIKTKDGLYGLDDTFSPGLNIIYSEANTKGKSSTLSGFFYTLGFEQIMGGVGAKTLSKAFKSEIEINNKIQNVLESGVYLEITNGYETVTLYRSVIHSFRKESLITVFKSNIDHIHDKSTESVDLYVHSQNSTINEKGFHRYLEEFIGLELPIVPSTDGNERKLYLQDIFSSMFVEQKNGWHGIMSAIPYLGIKDSKKRVIEYLLNLNILKNERLNEQLKTTKSRIENEWTLENKNYLMQLRREGFTLLGLQERPSILTEAELSGLKIVSIENSRDLDDAIDDLQGQIDKLRILKPKIRDNFNELTDELNNLNQQITEHQEELEEIRKIKNAEVKSIENLRNNLSIIERDILNNQDAAKLINLGSSKGIHSFLGKCPVCNQDIDDSLLIHEGNIETMSIDENINHLKAQKKTLEYAMEGHNLRHSQIQNSERQLLGSLKSLSGLALSIRSDLNSVTDDYSESTVLKRVQLSEKVNRLKELRSNLQEYLKRLQKLSSEWKEYLDQKATFSKNSISKEDEEKIKKFREIFAQYLKDFGYLSMKNLKDVEIHKDTLLPTVYGFDLKFDSSASDYIRAIWSFTLALSKASHENGGNHPRVIIFDEPNQHNIIPRDMEEFVKKVREQSDYLQCIIGLTVKDTQTQELINKLESVNIIRIKNMAFSKLL